MVPERDYLEVYDEPDDENGTSGQSAKDYLITSEDAEAVMVEGAVTFSLDGQYVSRRMLGPADKPPTKLKALSWFPQFGMFVQPDYAEFSSWLPVTPTLTQFRSVWVVHEDAVEGEDYDPERVIELIDVTNQEDDAICRMVGEGVLSSAYDNSAPYHPVYEWTVRPFLKTYQDYFETDTQDGGAR
jgi:Rieske 2Fe-2S family protein